MKKKSKPISKEMVLQAAREIVSETAEFWGLAEGTLSMDQVLAAGVDPTEFASPIPFRAAIENLAMGLASLQRKAAAAEEEPSPPPSDQEAQDAAWAAYEERVKNAKTPEQCFALHEENEQLLAAEETDARAETYRKAERAYELREKARRRQRTRGVPFIQETEGLGPLDGIRRVDSGTPPEEGEGIPSDAELFRAWQEAGAEVPGPED